MHRLYFTLKGEKNNLLGIMQEYLGFLSLHLIYCHSCPHPSPPHPEPFTIVSLTDCWKLNP